MEDRLDLSLGGKGFMGSYKWAYKSGNYNYGLLVNHIKKLTTLQLPMNLQVNLQSLALPGFGCALWGLKP